MTDDNIYDLFWKTIAAFPPELQRDAEDWLIERDASFQLFEEIQKKGLAALLPDDDGAA